MPTLILLRHGQASFGAADYDQLSSLGYQQAGLAAEDVGLRGIAPVALFSGELRRQRQTIEPLATRTGLTAGIDARWDEYRSDDILTAHSGSVARLGGDDAADVSPRRFQQILEDGLRAWAAAGEDSPASESWPAFRARADAALRETITALGSGETAVVATSAGTIAAACATLLGGDVETFVKLNRVAVNAAFTTVVSGASGQTLLAFNDHAHLQRGDGLITFR